MKGAKSRAFKIYFSALLLSIAVILLELLLSYFNRSICPTEGCKIAENLLLISKPSLLLIALLYFTFLLVLSLFYRSSKGQLFKFLLLFLLGLGFIGEWSLILKLLWEFRIKCYFCLIIVGLVSVVALSGLYVLSDERLSHYALFSLLIGCLSGLTYAQFVSTYPISGMSAQKTDTFVVYARGCPRCEELLRDPNYKDLPKIPVISLYPFLKLVGIETLPVIIEKSNGQVRVFMPKEREETICQPQPQGGLCVLP